MQTVDSTWGQACKKEEARSPVLSRSQALSPGSQLVSPPFTGNGAVGEDDSRGSKAAQEASPSPAPRSVARGATEVMVLLRPGAAGDSRAVESWLQPRPTRLHFPHRKHGSHKKGLFKDVCLKVSVCMCLCGCDLSVAHRSLCSGRQSDLRPCYGTQRPSLYILGPHYTCAAFAILFW